MALSTTKATFKSQLKRVLSVMLALYVMIFTYRLINGFFRSDESVANSANFKFSFSRKNYAGYHKIKGSYDVKGGEIASDLLEGEVSSSSDQKYERIATMTNTSLKYEEEEKKLYQKINQFKALIQYENKEGLKGERQLSLAIGVEPTQFDVMVEQLRGIGKNMAVEVNKTDKTTEYKELNAQKFSLEKSRNALIELKKNGGSLSDLISLEEKILEIEKKIQDMGVHLGSFDSENELCTIKFTLFEGSSPLKISLLHRVKVALLWTTQIYAGLLGFALLFLSVGVVGVFFLHIVIREIEKYNSRNP